MGVYEGRGHLTKGMKELMLRWSELKGQWDDPRSEAFEKRFLEPLEHDLRDAVGAMDAMGILLAQAKRDCE